jgi:hypothetical protein
VPESPTRAEISRRNQANQAMESGGGSSTTEKSRLSPTLIVALIVALIGGVATVLAAVINHGSNSTALTPPQATAPPHPETADDMMPVPNCPTCISGGKTFTEQAGGGSAKPTFRNPLVFGGLGPSVQPGKKVEVVCRFYQPNAEASVKPGWWYLIDSPPWNRQYYIAANSYLNGDPPEGPHIIPVDNGVPECTAKL